MFSGKGNLQKQCFLTLKTCVFHLLSSPTLSLRRSAEFTMREGCRMENFGGFGGE